MIVAFEKKYIDEIIQVYVEAFAGEPWNEDWENHWVLERVEWLASLPKFKGYLKLQNNKVIGAILGYSKPFKGRDCFEIVELFIGPDYQGRGAGKELVGFLENQLEKEGVAVVTLLTGLNAEPEKFYKKLSYTTNNQLCFMSRVL